MLGTSQLEMKNEQVEFLVAKNDFPIDLDGIAGLNFLKKHDALNDIANNRIKLQNEYYPIITNIHGYVDREKLIKENLRFDHMNNEEKAKVWNILRQFTNQFYFPEDPLSVIPGIKHKIITDTENPIFKPLFRLDREIHEQVRKLVKEQLEKGIIEESISPYSAPSHAVPKKIEATGKTKWRLVIDYTKLNEHTPQDNHPLPNMDEILESLGNCEFYSALDLAAGIHQIALDEANKEKTAFSSPDGHYQYRRLPMGLKNSPATFQRVMNNILRGLTYKICFVYLDDIIIFDKTLEEHNKNLEEVLKRLAQHGVKLQTDKCKFLRPELEYLGHVITPDGIKKTNPKKLKAVEEF